MALVILEIANLHILHWLISVLVPLLMIALAIVSWLFAVRLRRSFLVPLAELTDQIEDLPGRSLDHFPAVVAAARRTWPQAVVRPLERMKEDSVQLYQGRWLPDPRQALPVRVWLSPAQRSSISLMPAARILTIGILASLAAWLIQQPLPLPDPRFGLLLILLPVLTAVGAALPAAATAWHMNQLVNEETEAFYQTFCRHLPVFNDSIGTAELVDAYLQYDHKMQDGLNNFTEVTSRLAESDMADGIRRSVEQVLTESVAPSLQQSTSMLGQLAQTLTERQEQGMQDLAERFAGALSAQLAAHMHPINREIAQMGTLMADVKNYVELAMRAMETTRQQTADIQNAISQSVQGQQATHETLSTDLSRLQEATRALADTSQKLTDAFQGNEQNLAQSLSYFAKQLQDGTHGLTDTTRQALQMAGDIRDAAAAQQEGARQQGVNLQEQAEQFSQQLHGTIDMLLQQVHKETAAVAANTASIGSQLQNVNTTLGQTVDRFAQGSDAYVQQTLDRFDESLSEIVNRLVQTAAEIQDAVDALPSAIQRGAHFGS
ncbi:MAG: hypothetical protein GX112_13275 [Clostridiaceae bacterium]|jgi:ABC-type transporter Mla subunit MlaD|nr:hypothetical protein [Clostridiaceae bacterium]